MAEAPISQFHPAETPVANVLNLPNNDKNFFLKPQVSSTSQHGCCQCEPKKDLLVSAFVEVKRATTLI